MAIDADKHPDYVLSFVFTYFLNITHFSLKMLGNHIKYELKHKPIGLQLHIFSQATGSTRLVQQACSFADSLSLLHKDLICSWSCEGDN